MRPIQAAHHGRVGGVSPPGHGDALATFLEVWQEAVPPPTHHRLRRSPGKPSGRPGKPSSTDVTSGAQSTGPTEPRAVRRSAAYRTCWTLCPAPASTRPVLGQHVRPLRPLRSGLRGTAPKRDLDLGSWTPLRLPSPIDLGCPRAPTESEVTLHPHRRVLSAPSLGITEPVFSSGSAICQLHGHRRRLTGSAPLQHPGV